jgi:transmembrane sensor
MMTVDFVALGRYLDGRASQEERAAVEAWLSADAERRAAVAALQAVWAADARHFQAPYDTDAAWRRVRRGVGRAARPATVASRWRLPAIAAGLVVLLGVGAWWVGVHLVARPPALREYATPRGRRAVFRLLDGTEITLNADSRLGVPVRFGPRGRDVYLEGEAYFSVVHDTARPFVVHTPRSAIRDIGTRFGVHAYGDAAAERVAVAEGAVVLAETPLRAGQVATLSRGGAVRVLPGADVLNELAWTRGRLVFTSEPLGEAAQRLGRWYDLDVLVIDSTLAHRPITGSYSNEPVSEVLTLITSAVGARYEWRGRSVTISTVRVAR